MPLLCLPARLHSFAPLVYAPQDVNSKSRLVRLYYSNRIFMGFCCVCCEVLYLALFLLHIPMYQTLGLIDVQIPGPLLQAIKGGPLHGLVDHWQGLPVVGLVALLAVPGVVVKQVCNWVQLKAAVQGLVEHDVKRMS
jgi:CDP-diacylglycerol--inositol 3-phosphatidyltransferase